MEAALKKYDEQKNVVWVSLRWLIIFLWSSWDCSGDHDGLILCDYHYHGVRHYGKVKSCFTTKYCWTFWAVIDKNARIYKSQPQLIGNKGQIWPCSIFLSFSLIHHSLCSKLFQMSKPSKLSQWSQEPSQSAEKEIHSNSFKLRVLIIIILIIPILTNLIRQEPCVYVNGKPYNVRSTDDMANHLMMTEVRYIFNIILIYIKISTLRCISLSYSSTLRFPHSW